MSGRLEKLRVVDPVLTQLATGYTNAEFVGHHLLPFAYVEKEAGRIPTFGKDVFMEARTERAIRAKSNRLNPDDFEHVTYALDEHDLEYPIDYREDQESMYPLRAHATFTVVEKIRLRHELNTAAIVQDLNTYPVSNRMTLTGADQFTDPTSDPEGVIDDAKAAIAAATVQEPNVMVIGQQTWRALKRHPKLRGILADNRNRLVKLADLAEIFEVDKIVIGKGKRMDAQGNLVDIWQDNIILAYVPGAVQGGQDARKPSFGYTLRKRGQPVVDRYVEPGGKLELIRNTDIFAPYVLGADAGYLITNTNA